MNGNPHVYNYVKSTAHWTSVVSSSPSPSRDRETLHCHAGQTHIFRKQVKWETSEAKDQEERVLSCTICSYWLRRWFSHFTHCHLFSQFRRINFLFLGRHLDLSEKIANPCFVGFFRNKIITCLLIMSIPDSKNSKMTRTIEMKPIFINIVYLALQMSQNYYSNPSDHENLRCDWPAMWLNLKILTDLIVINLCKFIPVIIK